MTTCIRPSLVKATNNPFYTDATSYLWVNANSVHIKNLYAGTAKVFKDRICCGSQYIPQFAYYNHALEVNDGRVMNALEVISIMKSEYLKQKKIDIQNAQAIGDFALKATLKKSLPYITHSGVFFPRRNEGLKLPGFTYQLDIDKISNAEEILSGIIKDKQLNVLFASKSVSGNGVKAMIFLKELLFLRESWTAEQYRSAYHSATEILRNYFAKEYNVAIDTQMKAISQPFFLYYSPDIFVNKSLQQWI